MNKSVVAQADCPHETLKHTQDWQGNTMYWCPACMKQVVMPFYLLEPVLPTMRAIREAFGEHWADLVGRSMS